MALIWGVHCQRAKHIYRVCHHDDCRVAEGATSIHTHTRSRCLSLLCQVDLRAKQLGGCTATSNRECTCSYTLVAMAAFSCSRAQQLGHSFLHILPLFPCILQTYDRKREPRSRVHQQHNPAAARTVDMLCLNQPAEAFEACPINHGP